MIINDGVATNSHHVTCGRDKVAFGIDVDVVSVAEDGVVIGDGEEQGHKGGIRKEDSIYKE